VSLRITALLWLIAAAVWPASAARAQDLVIGIAAPITGNLAHIGAQLVEAAQLAVDETNARGGIGGRRVVVRVEDDQADPKVATTAARKLAVDERVVAVLGHYSTAASLAAMPIYTKARLAAITPTAASADLTKRGGKYLFRMLSPSSVFARNLARYAVQTLGKKAIAVIHGQSDWGVSAKDAFVKELEKVGAKAAVLQPVNEADADFRGRLKKVKAANPDAVAILTYYTTGALVTLQARSVEITAPLIGTGALHEDKFIELAGPGNAEGVTVNTEFSSDDPTPVVRDFVAAHQKGHPDQKPDAYHALAYDAMRVMLGAIERAGADRDAVRDAIAATTSFVGVTGTFAFNDQRERDATDQPYVVVKDGMWTFAGRH
jgi:branched-chain amino acid transport system substrate-binding protein